MRKRNLFTLLLLGAFCVPFLTNCGGGKTEASTNQVEETVDADTLPKPGEIPFDFPVVSTTAEKGQYALAPPKEWVDESFEKAKADESFTYIFYSVNVIAPGAEETEVDYVGTPQKVPNSLVIPIPAGQEAAKGDVILSWWQSGSGMQRAYVVDDATPGEPVIKYLDMDWDNDDPTAVDDSFKPNSFFKLTEDWQPGTTVAHNTGSRQEALQVIRVEGDKVLTSGWGGSMDVVKKSDCTPIPIKVEVAAGDKVQVPHLGSFTNGTVVKYDAEIGRVFTEIEFAGEKKEIAVPFGDVATDLMVTD